MSLQIFSSKHPSTDDDDEISRNDRKHGIHNRPQRCEPYRENKGPGAGDEQVQVKSKRIHHDAGVIADRIGLQPGSDESKLLIHQ